jgi:hypothetical protein
VFGEFADCKESSGEKTETGSELQTEKQSWGFDISV